VAWGPRKESWSVDYRVLEGDTARAPVWEKLTALFDETWRSVDGVDMSILSLAIDSGFATTEVYSWARTMGLRSPRIMVIKGDSRASALLERASPMEVGPAGLKLKKGLRIWPVNSSMAKDELYRWLRQERPTEEDLARGIQYPPGYCHFPKYSDEFFKQLTAEQLVTRIVKGYRKPEWQKMRERNEALDARVYARAAASRVGIDRFQEAHWTELTRRVKVHQPPPTPPSSPPPVTPPSSPTTPAANVGRGRRGTRWRMG
jgi:phage terminase large subunit GpA-like protein